MPYRTFKYMVLEADTRSLEFWLAGMTMVWALWTGLVRPVHTDTFWNMVSKYGGGGLIFVGFVVSCIQFWSIHYKYPRTRSLSSYLGTCYWMYWVWMAFTTDPYMGGMPIYVMFALGCAASLIHRTATGK